MFTGGERNDFQVRHPRCIVKWRIKLQFVLDYIFCNLMYYERNVLLCRGSDLCLLIIIIIIIIIISKISCGLRIILSIRCISNSCEIYIKSYNYWEFLQTVRKNALTRHLQHISVHPTAISPIRLDVGFQNSKNKILDVTCKFRYPAPPNHNKAEFTYGYKHAFR